MVAAEALSRFEDDRVGPDVWFERAHGVGLGTALELAAVGRALQLLDQLPPGLALTVNVSPTVAVDAGLVALLSGVDTRRVVVELTEQLPLADGADPLAGLRRTGARIAVDDAGAGHAGLQRLLRARPDVIKLDRWVSHGVAADPAKEAMVRAIRDFATSVGAVLVAEGLEDEADLQAVRDLGVRWGQGWSLGRPQPPSALVTTATS